MKKKRFSVEQITSVLQQVAAGVPARSSVYYQSRKEPLTALRERMRELAQTRVRFGYRRLRVLMD